MQIALILLLSLSAVLAATCGNGILEAGETCDTGIVNDVANQCVNCQLTCLGQCTNLRNQPACRSDANCTQALTCVTVVSVLRCKSINYTCNDIDADCNTNASSPGVQCQPVGSPFPGQCVFTDRACNNGTCAPSTGTCTGFTCFGTCGDGYVSSNTGETCDDGTRFAPDDGCVNCLCTQPTAVLSNPRWCKTGSQLNLTVTVVRGGPWIQFNGGTCFQASTPVGTIVCSNATTCSCMFNAPGNFTGVTITFQVGLRNVAHPCNTTTSAQNNYVVPNTNTISTCIGVCGNGLLEAGEQCDDNNNLSGDGCVNCLKTCFGACSNFPIVNCTSNASCTLTPSCVFSEVLGRTQCRFDGRTCTSSLQCPSAYICSAGTCIQNNLGTVEGQCAAICTAISGTCGCGAAVCGDNITTSPEQCDDGSVVGNDGCNNCFCANPTGTVFNLTANSPICAPGQPLVITGSLSMVSWAQVYNATCTTATTVGTLVCSTTSCTCTIAAPMQPWDPSGVNVSFSIGVQNSACLTRIIIASNSTLVPISSELPCQNFCGNGVLESGEACDDGNQVNADGCSGCVKDCNFTCSNLAYRACTQNSHCTAAPTCEQVTLSMRRCEILPADCNGASGCPVGYACGSFYCFQTAPGQCPCVNSTGICGNPVCTPTCGDAIKQGAEQCDDGTLVGGDGCANCVCEIPPDSNFTITSEDQICGGGQTITAYTTFVVPSWVQLVNSSCAMGSSIGVLNCISTSCSCTIMTPPGPYNPGGVSLSFTFGVRNAGCPNVFVNVTRSTLIPLSETVCLDFCGNGILEDGEECDDGNDVDGDGCTSCVQDCHGFCSGFSAQMCRQDADCEANATCTPGNGEGQIVCRLENITCASTLDCPNGYSCAFNICRRSFVDTNCTIGCPHVSSGPCVDDCDPLCNNGIVESPEECDDGSLILPDGCVNCTCVPIPPTELTISTLMQICGPGDTIVVDVSFGYPSWVNVSSAICFLDNEHPGVLSCSAPGVCTCTFTTPENMFDIFPCDYGVPVTVQITLDNPDCPNVTVVLTDTLFVPILHCSDNVFCNGMELCSTTEGCLPSAGPPVCDDGNDCTLDYCSESECRIFCFETYPEDPGMCLYGCAGTESSEYTACLEQLQACTGNALTCNSAFQACYTGSGCRMAITETEGCPCQCNFIKQDDQSWPEPN